MNKNFKNDPKLNIGLVQINNSFSGQEYLPLTAGSLQVYVEKYFSNPSSLEFQLPIFMRISVDDAVKSLSNTNIVFFSIYIWNYRLSLAIAKSLKFKYPDIITVFGGPQVPDHAEDFLNKYSFINIAVHGEGERVALTLLEEKLNENLTNGNFTNIPGISYLSEDKSFKSNPKLPRLKDLSEYPSPFLEGVFDPLMKKYPNITWMALWETNRGCPFSCTFCDWGSATVSKIYQFYIDRIYKEIEWFSAHKIEYVYCCDANFGALKRDIDIVKKVAKIKNKTGFPKKLSVFNTKNVTDRAYIVQKILSDSGLHKGVDIAFQSLDHNTLDNIKRSNISLSSFFELQKRFTNDGVQTYSELIMGLPGETYDSFVEGYSSLIKNGQHNRIRSSPLTILPNAEMADPESIKKYKIETVEVRSTNQHGSVDQLKEIIYETQHFVISTDSMPTKDWIRTRKFHLSGQLLYFNKLLQIPFIVINELYQISYRHLIEEFCETNISADFNIINDLMSSIHNHAVEMTKGGLEFIGSDMLQLMWPVDEHLFIDLVSNNKLEEFYNQSEIIIKNLLSKKSINFDNKIIEESIMLNKLLIKQPYQYEDIEVQLSYNIYDFYNSVKSGNKISFKKKQNIYNINKSSTTWPSIEDWSREVVWYQNSTGAYMYDAKNTNFKHTMPAIPTETVI